MTGSPQHEFQPEFTSSPGDTLRDVLADQNLSQAELAARTGLSAKHVNQIMQGVAPISQETSIALERATGMPASFWNRREADYREALLRARRHTPDADDVAWLQTLPTTELQERGFLRPARSPHELFDGLMSFFGVADRKAYERVWSGRVASFRRSHAFASEPGAVIAWLRVAQIEAQSQTVEPYSPARFRSVLKDIRALTADGDPNDIVELCATAGVVVVFVSEITGCRISGAAWWTTPTRAVIALSDRYKKDDFFWFAFFHEAAHLLLHSKKETFVDDGTDSDLLEDEANRWAADFLVPPERALELHRMRSDADVAAFAASIGIAPGIVVGRMQHDGIWPYKRGNRLKQSLRIVS